MDRPPIADGIVLIHGDRIVSVGTDDGGCPILDAGDVAILPGLCNAHTHLEFSDLPQPLGRPGLPLPDWIRQVVAWRRQAQPGPAAILRGLRESAGHGVTTLGEIATSWTGQHYLDPPLDVTVFLELLGLRAERAAPLIAAAEQHVAVSPAWRPGLSPHAPYSLHADVLRHAVNLSQKTKTPLAMHLAESREEVELLRTGGGPFRHLLEELNAWDDGAFAQPQRPLDYLQRLAAAERSLVIHGNYLDDEEIGFLSEHAAQMAVVYCPRTHAYFGHERYPLEKLLSAGATVALGTDSRASSPDLDLLAEMRLVAQVFPAISPAAVLRLGTLGGAEALGRAADVGSLTPSKAANLAVLSLPNHAATDPHELIFDAGARVESVLCRGTWLARA